VTQGLSAEGRVTGADGVKVATSLRTELPDCRVLIVTSHGRPGHLKRALEAGVRGFVLTTVSAQRLAEIIRTVHGEAATSTPSWPRRRSAPGTRR